MKFYLPQPADTDYGREWPVSQNGEPVSQIVKELYGFKANGSEPGFMSRYEHGLRLVRLLWPDFLDLFKVWTDHRTGKKSLIWNTFFMRVFKACCEHDTVGLTGCASSGKTFAVAAYAILRFMAEPEETTIMVSTTAGTDAERRIWGEIKKLHEKATGVFRVGTLIDYLKVITFQPSAELLGSRSVESRDIRNGIMLMPIPPGGEGAKAMGKIIGTKNKKMVWIIDELPHMFDGVLKSEANIMANIYFQLIGIGNAKERRDPHGLLCEPAAGWDAVGEDTESWTSSTGAHIEMLHGEKSPNFHEAVDPMLPKPEMPFPYLSDPNFIRNLAFKMGQGDEAAGRRTVEFWRFGKGFWPGEDVVSTILSAAQIKRHNAHLHVGAEPVWASTPVTVAGLDPSWTSGGDDIALMWGKLGRAFIERGGIVSPRLVLWCAPEAHVVRVEVSDRETLRRMAAQDIVRFAQQRNLRPENLGMDISSDGGLVMQELIKAWKSTEIVGLSSTEVSPDEKFDRMVTRYWYRCSDAVNTGNLIGFNIESKYAKDLFTRRYESLGVNRVKVERKKDMKKRIGRSPDHGDAFAYMVEMAIREGFDPTVTELTPVPGRARSGDQSDLPANLGYLLPEWRREDDDVETVEFGEAWEMAWD